MKVEDALALDERVRADGVVRRDLDLGPELTGERAIPLDRSCTSTTIRTATPRTNADAPTPGLVRQKPVERRRGRIDVGEVRQLPERLVGGHDCLDVGAERRRGKNRVGRGR